MTILAIDTSCDDTSVAVLRNRKILANVVSSQDEVHQQWGGVVPSLAKRAHQERIDAVVALAMRRSGVEFRQVDAIAVTNGPGLAIALEVGIAKAKELALTLEKPIVAVNHMEGHIYANFAEMKRVAVPQYPFVALLVSGGHTELVRVEAAGNYTLLGETLDDAAGEAYDKVARMLGLGYPGGALLAKLAESGNPSTYVLPRPLAGRKDIAFSFSGLKAAALRLVNTITDQGKRPLKRKEIEDVAAAFQGVAIEHLVKQSVRAMVNENIPRLVLGGGVAANVRLRSELRKRIRKTFGADARLYYPHGKKLCSDNAAMIGLAAYDKARRGEVVQNVAALDRDPMLSLAGSLGV